MLHIYNTLSRAKEPFEPMEAGKVGLYVCGITTYDYCHVGHARMLSVFDVLYRHLQNSGYAVNYVRNITDIDDKIIARAKAMELSVAQLTERFIAEMRHDEASLALLPPTHEPRATETIDEMVSMIATLIDTDYAYAAANGDVYYAVKRFAGYGKLSGRKLDELRAGERVDIDKHKRDPLDFVLWKAAKAGEPSWHSPWGDGRPGWHIECSAMAKTLLGEEFDIHGGGADLQFPHHENEIAQSEAASGKSFARYWMHNGLVRVDDEKMSKSLDNFFTVREVLKVYSGEELRLFLISSHYRSPLNYSLSQLDAARAALRRLYIALRYCPQDEGAEALDNYAERFNAAMDDDLNTPEAIAVLFDLATALNRETDRASNNALNLGATLRLLGARIGLLQADPDRVLQGEPTATDGFAAAEVRALIDERTTARSSKNWKRSDEIRDLLVEKGIVLEDSGGETTWRRQ